MDRYTMDQIDQKILVEGYPVHRRGRVIMNSAQIRDTAGAVLARATGKFILVSRDPIEGTGDFPPGPAPPNPSPERRISR